MADTDAYVAAGQSEIDRWLSIGEAAKRAGVSIETLRRYDDNGQLKASRSPGRQRRYLQSQIDAAFPRPTAAAASP